MSSSMEFPRVRTRHRAFITASSEETMGQSGSEYFAFVSDHLPGNALCQDLSRSTLISARPLHEEKIDIRNKKDVVAKVTRGTSPSVERSLREKHAPPQRSRLGESPSKAESES